MPSVMEGVATSVSLNLEREKSVPVRHTLRYLRLTIELAKVG